jgi:hypothetical protein
MNLWKQTRRYTCHKCGASYLHDRGYEHNLFTCTQRPRTRTQILAQFLLNGRCYHPMAERTR